MKINATDLMKAYDDFIEKNSDIIPNAVQMVMLDLSAPYRHPYTEMDHIVDGFKRNVLGANKMYITNFARNIKDSFALRTAFPMFNTLVWLVQMNRTAFEVFIDECSFAFTDKEISILTHLSLRNESVSGLTKLWSSCDEGSFKGIFKMSLSDPSLFKFLFSFFASTKDEAFLDFIFTDCTEVFKEAFDTNRYSMEDRHSIELVFLEEIKKIAESIIETKLFDALKMDHVLSGLEKDPASVFYSEDESKRNAAIDLKKDISVLYNKVTGDLKKDISVLYKNEVTDDIKKDISVLYKNEVTGKGPEDTVHGIPWDIFLTIDSVSSLPTPPRDKTLGNFGGFKRKG